VSDLSKLVQIYGLSLTAQIIFNFFNFYILFSRIKFANYHVPLIGTFDSLWKFVIAAWLFNAPMYICGTILVGYAYRLSVLNFEGMYLAFIGGQISSVLTSILFIWLTAGEIPNRNGWIAIALVFLASFFAAHSSKPV